MRFSPFNYLALGLIRFYQLALRSYCGSCCRFFPSCSDYALEVFKKYSFIKALFKTLVRILKCGPWHRGGYDPS